MSDSKARQSRWVAKFVYCFLRVGHVKDRKKPIEIPSGVEATIKEGTIEVKGVRFKTFDFSKN